MSTPKLNSLIDTTKIIMQAVATSPETMNKTVVLKDDGNDIETTLGHIASLVYSLWEDFENGIQDRWDGND